MRPSKRLERIPPYAFAELERKIAAKRAAGVDVISLGIGDPDRPTPRADRRGDAGGGHRARDPPLPRNRGREDFREARARLLRTPLRREARSRHEIIPAIGAKEAIFNLNLAFLDPGDYALASDPGYPVYTGGRGWPAASRC